MAENQLSGKELILQLIEHGYLKAWHAAYVLSRADNQKGEELLVENDAAFARELANAQPEKASLVLSWSSRGKELLRADNNKLADELAAKHGNKDVAETVEHTLKPTSRMQGVLGWVVGGLSFGGRGRVG